MFLWKRTSNRTEWSLLGPVHVRVVCVVLIPAEIYCIRFQVSLVSVSACCIGKLSFYRHATTTDIVALRDRTHDL